MATKSAIELADRLLAELSPMEASAQMFCSLMPYATPAQRKQAHSAAWGFICQATGKAAAELTEEQVDEVSKATVLVVALAAELGITLALLQNRKLPTMHGTKPSSN